MPLARPSRNSRRGQSFVEYAVILGVIAIVVIATVTIVGRRSNDSLSSVNRGLRGSSDYTAGVLADAPIGYWRLNEPAGATTVADSMGTARGTVSAGVTLGQPRSSGAPAVQDGAASFASGFVDMGTNAAFVMTTGTLEAWVRLSAMGGSFEGILVKQGGYGLFAYQGHLDVYDWPTLTNHDSGVAIDDSAWHHVVMSFQSAVPNGTLVYVDGAQVLQTGITAPSNPYHLDIGAGALSGSQYFPGKIVEVAIYNRVLSPEQVAAHYRLGVAGL